MKQVKDLQALHLIKNCFLGNILKGIMKAQSIIFTVLFGLFYATRQYILPAMIALYFHT